MQIAARIFCGGLVPLASLLLASVGPGAIPQKQQNKPSEEEIQVLAKPASSGHKSESDVCEGVEPQNLSVSAPAERRHLRSGGCHEAGETDPCQS